MKRKYVKLTEEMKRRIIEAGQEIVKDNPHLPKLRLIQQAISKAYPDPEHQYSAISLSKRHNWFFEGLTKPKVEDNGILQRIENDNKAIIDILLEVASKLNDISKSLVRKPEREEKKLPRIAVVGVLKSQSGRILSATKDIANVTCYQNVDEAARKGVSNYELVISTRHVSHHFLDRVIADIGKNNLINLPSTNISDIIGTIQNYAKSH